MYDGQFGVLVSWESHRCRLGNLLSRMWARKNTRSRCHEFPGASIFVAESEGFSSGRATYCLWLTKYCLHSNIKDGNRYNFDDSTFRGRAKVTSICLLTCYNGNAAWGVLLSVLTCMGKLPSSKCRFQSLFLNCSKRAGCPVTSRT